MMLAGNKYVPPHMRNRPVPAAEPVSRFNQLKPKKTKTGLKKLKKIEIKPAQVIDEIKIKPHCELFIADIPATMRSVTTLAGFFHPYGEIANIQIIPVGQKFPEECSKFINVDQFENTFCAIIEFLTARVAKFVVGVLRKRIEALNFRIGLLKPGLAEEMSIQEGRLKESIYMPSYTINQTQEAMLNGSLNGSNAQSYSSEELSEVELNQTRNKRAILRISNDPAYWTGSSGISSGSSGSEIESDGQSKRPISESSDDDDCDLLALALKNGIKVTRST